MGWRRKTIARTEEGEKERRREGEKETVVTAAQHDKRARILHHLIGNFFPTMPRNQFIFHYS